ACVPGCFHASSRQPGDRPATGYRRVRGGRSRGVVCHGRCMIPAFSDPLIAANATGFPSGKRAAVLCLSSRETKKEEPDMHRFCGLAVAMAGVSAAGAALAADNVLAPVEIIARPLNAAADIEPEDSTSPVRVVDRDAFENRI